MKRILRATLADCDQATGIVAVIDVLRAFTTAAFAFASGAKEIFLVSSVEEALLLDQSPDPDPYLLRVRNSRAGRVFADPLRPAFPAADLEYATAIDRFSFAMPIVRQGDRLVMRQLFS